MVERKMRTWVRCVAPGAITVAVVALMLTAFRVWAMPGTAAPAASAVWGAISYQGQLADAGGEPVDGEVDMNCRLYNVPETEPDPALWEEAHVDVPVHVGAFNVLLGSVTPIPDSVWTLESLYLGVQVAGDEEMAPREPVGMVPYALHAVRAETAQTAQSAQSAESAQTAQSANRAYGLSATDGDPADAVIVNDTGKVGIGTSPHYSSLTIRASDSSNLVSFKDKDDNAQWHLSYTAGGLDFVETGEAVGRLHLEDGGNVGIGTTSPDRPLTIQGVGANSEWIGLKDKDGYPQWHLNYYGGGIDFVETGVASGRLHLEDGGNVGIGTDDPQAKLDVNGDVKWSGHLQSMTVSDEYVQEADHAGPLGTQMIAASSGMCFLTGVDSLNADAVGAICRISVQGDGYWWVHAQATGGYVRCGATCVQW